MDSNDVVVDYADVTSRAKEVEADALALVTSAESFAITTAEQYESSADFLKRIKAKGNALRDLRLSMTRPIDEAKARVMDLFRPAGDQLDRAEQILKKAMITFTTEEERKRKEIEDAAREQAEKEAAKLQRQADKARMKGKDDKADELEERAVTVPTPIVPSEVPKVSGVAFRTTWHAEVEDFELLVLEVATGHQPMALLQANQKVLDAQARSLKNQMKIPGVRAVPDQGVAARGKS